MKRKRYAGFSLMELIVAISVFSLAMLTLAFTFGKDIFYVKQLYQEEIATQIIQGQLEAIRAKPYSEIKDCVNAQVALDSFTSQSLAALKFAKCTMTIKEFDPQNPGLKRVKVTLQWLGRPRKLRQRTMETLITDVGR